MKNESKQREEKVKRETLQHEKTRLDLEQTMIRVKELEESWDKRAIEKEKEETYLEIKALKMK